MRLRKTNHEIWNINKQMINVPRVYKRPPVCGQRYENLFKLTIKETPAFYTNTNTFLVLKSRE
jgi:hypothetical protein